LGRAPVSISSEFELVNDPASTEVELSTASDDEVSMLGDDNSFEVLDASKK
jgi:hypothetical protein